MKRIRIALSVILILVFAYIFIGQLILPANVPVNGNICDVLPGDAWYEVKEDGSRVPFDVPGHTDGEIIVETKLPAVFKKDYCVLMFRGMDMDIYIDNELRESLKTEDYKFFGDQSAECFVIASIYPEDAGHTLRVRYEYNSGMVYEVYIGTRLGVLAYLFDQYGLELFVGLSILLLGVICLVASVCYKLIHKKYLEMEHLSIGVIIGAMWVLSNSVFRQLYSRNLSVMSDIPFIMVMIMPLPFFVFIDSLQKGRYSKALTAVSLLEIVNFSVCTLLFVFGKVSLINSFIPSALCALISIAVMFATIFLDVKRRLAYSYKVVAFGFVLLAIAALIQIAVYQFAHNGVFSGLFMAFGLFGFMICAIIHTIKQLIGIRLEATELQHTNKAKDDFLANMSHEIRTPLNGILGMDEMIIRDTREEKVKNYALEIKSAGNTLLSIINDILDMSKIEAGKFEIIPVDYDIASVLNDVLNLTRYRAQKKELEYSFTVAEDIPSRLNGDEIRIRQIMLNIINNAIKYTKRGSVNVNISSVSTMMGNYIDLIIKVKDTGIGIREEDKEKLFNSFQRLEEKKNRNIEGTGLGLFITQKMLEMMEGKIEVESEYGKGSCFTVTVPQKVVKAAPIGNFSKAVKEMLNNQETETIGLYAPDARILVVDDNEMNLEVMEGLIRDTKIKTDLVDSGAGCIELVKSKKYDCILMDQMMPGMSGEETLNVLKEQDLLNGTPVVALTADAIIGAEDNYISKGFTSYLSKPVKYDALEKALKKLLPKEKQLNPNREHELPLLLIWGNDPEKLRIEKDRLDGTYRCVCVTGSKAMEKYLEKHTPDVVMKVGG
ncbi:MAG: response regulator [Lachnospiraceae bacterium]|nr:response regulator [Lachnospiraceae bacterium]